MGDNVTALTEETLAADPNMMAARKRWETMAPQ
jgi:hypothetical protein